MNEGMPNYVKDIKNKRGLESTEAKTAAEKLKKRDFADFDQKIENSFQTFLNEQKNKLKDNAEMSKDELQKQFNEWLDKSLNDLEILKNDEIEEAIIKPTSFELVGFQTVQELLKLEEEVLEKNKSKIREKFLSSLGTIARDQNKKEVENAKLVAKDIIATDGKVFFNGDEVGIDDFLEALSNKKIKFSGLTLSSEPEYKLEDNMPKIKKIEFSGEGEVETKKDTVSQGTDTHIEDEQRNKYQNLENDTYGEAISEEVIAENYKAIIDYMDGKDNKNIEQAFKRLKINPNNIANTLAQILEDNKDVTKGSFTIKNISKKAMNQLGKNRLFVNEQKRLVQILNEVPTNKLNQFINEMKVFNDIKELQNTKKFIEINKEKIQKQPFLVLSDFNRSGTLDRGAEGIKHNGRTSEQAMYNTFVSLANTVVKGGNKEIINGEKTADLVKGFVSMIKSVGDGRYNDIENEFSGYTMEELGKYIVNHRETLTLYKKTLNELSYNSSIDILNIVSHNRRQAVIDNDMQEIKELSTNRDEVRNRFSAQMKKDPKLKEFYNTLSEGEKKNWIGNFDAFLGEHGLLRTIVNTFGVRTNTGVTLDDLEKVHTKWESIFQDGVKSHLMIGVPFKDGFINLSIPIVNFTGDTDINRSSVENSVINGVNPIYQIYGRIGANIGGGVTLPNGESDSELGAHLSAAIEAAIGVKVDYKKGIELSARHFGEVLQKQIFKDPDFSSKEGFKTKATKSIQDIVDGKNTDKESKDLRKFIKNNKQEMSNCVDNVSNLLDTMGVFNNDKKPEHKVILLDSIMKGIVEQVKNQNIEEMDGKTKLTRLGIFGQVGAGAGYTKDGLSAGFGWGAGVEATISAWNMIYLPDKEKYQYMDAQLKSGKSIKPLGEGVRTDSLENVKKAIIDSLSENSIPNIKVESNDKGQIEISVEDDVLKKYEKNNIYELFNIYVNPDKKGNVAISEDGKTLLIGGNELENFSVATRNYFDDFAVYLMIGGKGIDGCGNNKINEETIGEYNTAEHFKSVPGFEFKSQESITEPSEPIDAILSENNTTSGFKAIENALSKIDDEKWNDYVKFMEETCDTNDDGFIKNEDYNNAFNIVKKLLNTSKDSKLSEIKNIINGINDDNEKVYVVDRFKMIFSLISETNTVDGLKSLAKKRGNTYESLKGYARTDEEDGEKFPLAGKSYRDKLINSLGNGRVDRKTNANLIGMTAFYKRGYTDSTHSQKLGQQLVQAYGYSMTEIGGTDYLGDVYNIENDDLQETQKWFLKNLNKSEVHKNILKNTFSKKIGNEITDEQLLQLLKGEEIKINIDNGVKKVKIEVDYVFYLLGECANESIGVKLGNMTIVTKTKTTTDTDETTNPEDNVLDVGVDGQTLTSTTALEQSDLSGKVGIGSKFDDGKPRSRDGDGTGRRGDGTGH